MTTSNNIPLNRLLEVNNAKNLTREEITRTFVPQDSFWRILTPKNHVVMGSRGSGKTAIAKMISHSHLSEFNHPLAHQIIQRRNLIGLYVPARLSWLGSQIEKDSDDVHALEQFVWKLNLATAFGLLDSLESCLNTYFPHHLERARREMEIADHLSRDWDCSSGVRRGLSDLRKFLFDLDFEKKTKFTELRLGLIERTEVLSVGVRFHLELFEPLRRAIAVATDYLDLPSAAAWLVCLDEIEFLDEVHHRLINSHMRADAGNVYFKCTTLPYKHYTKTTTTSVPINEKHDFEYLYLDQDVAQADHRHLAHIPEFMSQIYERRLTAGGWSKTERKSLTWLLGTSKLIDPVTIDWAVGGHFWKLLEKYCNEQTRERARRYVEHGQERLFNDSIGRKIAPALRLRNSVEKLRGREELDIYSGATLVARCSDGNPRIFLSLINRMFMESNNHVFTAQSPGTLRPIRPNIQNKVLTEFSRNELQKLQSEEHGRRLHRLVSLLGSYMSGVIHQKELGTDFISSFSVDFSESLEVSDTVKEAVGLGCMFPSVNPKDPDRMPEEGGVFHLGFKFAPHFKILPRKGKSIPINSAVSAMRESSESDDQLSLFGGAA